MSGFGAPPVIPDEFQIYNSYVEDPKWQTKFSIIWASVLSAGIIFSLPYLVRSIRSKRAFVGWRGVTEKWGEEYTPILSEKGRRAPPPKSRSRKLEGLLSMLGSFLLWSAPGIGLNVGQIVLLIGYAVSLVICITKDAILVENSNRAGFVAIAQFPVVFLFATKNNIVSLLLGPGNGYERLNFIHRWAGRGMLLGAIIHGALWIQNHVVWDLPILGPQKETSGVASLAMLCIIALTSLKPVRIYFYQVFFYLHILSFVGFFITVCYHTIYAPPWIFPPLAFYGFDMLLRLFKYRIKDATLTPVDNQMTLIHIPHCDTGWEAGQHIRLRVFFSGRVLESHPLSIMNATAPVSCVSDETGGGIVLGARVKGDWTRALNRYAQSALSELSQFEEKKSKSTSANVSREVPVQVMIDGPYGGSSIDLGSYESVLLIAGGSGVTFTLGLLDDIVGRVVRLKRPHGEKTRRIEFSWCVKSFGTIGWFEDMLAGIANTVERAKRQAEKAGEEVDLDLHISVYVTCLCNPDAIPPIPNLDVSVYRPSVKEVLEQLVTPPTPRSSSSSPAPSSSSSIEEVPRILSASTKGKVIDPESSLPESITNKLTWVGLGGGVGVCASGPESLTREVGNAVAGVGMTRGLQLGGLGLHTEVYTM